MRSSQGSKRSELQPLLPAPLVRSAGTADSQTGTLLEQVLPTQPTESNGFRVVSQTGELESRFSKAGAEMGHAWPLGSVQSHVLAICSACSCAPPAPECYGQNVLWGKK